MNTRRALVVELGSKITTDICETIERCIRCCINCEHFEEKPEECKLAHDPKRPPARVIAFGCHKFSERIPF